MLKIHRADRSESLAAGLADVLKTPLAEPFAREVIAVPAKGVERWINQQLSTVLGARGTDGIAANIAYPSLARIVDDAIARASGVDPDADPWDRDRLTWTVLQVIDDSLGESWCAVLARHLGYGKSSHRNGRRYATAQHLAGLFTSYATQRPSILIDWANGIDAVEDDLKWQPELFRRVRARIGESPAERLGPACAALRAQPDLVELPERISVFGPTRLTTDQIEVLRALAEHRDVHLWFPHPSPAMWAAVTPLAEPKPRGDDRSALLLAHPLLASLAHSVREMQMQLGPVASEHHPSSSAPQTVLGQLQDDVRNDREPSKINADNTIQIHSCHGPARQVEVLREVLLRVFDDDPTLEPRDVLVMCPDVETYAPLIRAGFGQGIEGHPAHGLRVRLADRALHQTNPLLSVVSQLLLMAGGRVTATQLLDLAAASPVALRFGFADDQQERIREWVAASGARWGLGERQRKAFLLEGFPGNAFDIGVDRVLLGVVADEAAGQWLDKALPLDVESNDIVLAGRFAEFIDCLDEALSRLEQTQPGQDWIAALTDAIDHLTAVPRGEEWQIVQARREFAAAINGVVESPLRLPDVRAMLSECLAGRPTRSNFRTGELTVCTMVPMRSVPHRVIALLGLDDDEFPRKARIDGDDALAREPMVGERERRAEDRQLLLDAIMAARDKLLLFYTGADPVNGKDVPPAIPLGEVMDVVAAMTGGNVVRKHPLQPFDPQNFDATDPFSFDVAALGGARSNQLPPLPIPKLWDAPLSELPAGDVDLKALTDFVVHPSKAFLRQRFGISLEEFDVTIRDDMPIEVAGLDEWNVGDRMLQARLAGVEDRAFLDAEFRRGTMPPRKIGQIAYRNIRDAVNALVSAARQHMTAEAETRDVSLDLGDGRRLVGTISGIHGSCLTRVSYSSVKTKHRLEAWVQLLALAASEPGEWSAVSIGKYKSQGRFRATVRQLRAPDNALELLSDLVALRDEGLRRPLHIAPLASEAFASARRGTTPATVALERAEKAWTDKFGDHTDNTLRYLYGPKPNFDDFADVEFQELAVRVWQPLLAVES